jgi:hypothetical protein
MFKFEPDWLYLDLMWVQSRPDAPIQMNIAGLSYVTADMQLKFYGRQNVYDDQGEPDLQRVFSATSWDAISERNIDTAPGAALALLHAATSQENLLGLPGVKLSEVDVVHLQCLGHEVAEKLASQHRDWYGLIGEILEDNADVRF